MPKPDVRQRQQHLLERSAQLRASLCEHTQAIQAPLSMVGSALTWGQRLWRVWRLWQGVRRG